MASMRAIDWRSSVAMLKTVYLAVDFDHSESPPHGRSAVEWLERRGITLQSKYTQGRGKAETGSCGSTNWF